LTSENDIPRTPLTPCPSLMDFQGQPVGVMEKSHLFPREIIGTDGLGDDAQAIEFRRSLLHGFHPKGEVPEP